MTAAEPYFLKAQQLDPELQEAKDLTATNYLQLFRFFNTKNTPQDATNVLQKWIEAQPGNADPRFMLFDTCMNAQDKAAATLVLKTVVGGRFQQPRFLVRSRSALDGSRSECRGGELCAARPGSRSRVGLESP